MKIKERYPYQKQWEEYRRRRNRQYVVGVACLLTSNLVFFAVLKSGMESNKAAVLASFLSIVAVIVTLAVIYHFHG